jgi:hypothetical protein
MTTGSPKMSETRAMKVIREEVERDGKADELPLVETVDETRMAAAQAAWRERRKTGKVEKGKSNE